MADVVKCPSCGIRTGAERDVCPRCAATLAGAPVTRCDPPVAPEITATTPPLSPPPGTSATTDEPPPSVFDTDISALFPKQRRFGVIDFVLLAGLVAWTFVASDVRIWVRDGVGSFGAGAATTGVTRAHLPESSEEAAPPSDVDPTAPLADPPADAAPTPEADVPEPPDVDHLAAGAQAFDAHDFVAAHRHFEEAVATTPTDARAQNNLAQTLVRLEQLGAAMSHFERAVQLDPDRWAYHFNLAHTLGELGWWNRAAARYRHAARLRPEDHATHYNLARAQHEWGDYRGAVESYLEAIAQAPDEPSLYLSIGQSYEAMRRPADAMTAYTRYLSMEPSSDEANALRGRLDALGRSTGANR